MKDMNKKEILEAVKFNLDALLNGVIEKEDFLQAIEEELNLL